MATGAASVVGRSRSIQEEEEENDCDAASKSDSQCQEMADTLDLQDIDTTDLTSVVAARDSNKYDDDETTFKLDERGSFLEEEKSSLRLKAENDDDNDANNGYKEEGEIPAIEQYKIKYDERNAEERNDDADDQDDNDIPAQMSAVGLYRCDDDESESDEDENDGGDDLVDLGEEGGDDDDDDDNNDDDDDENEDDEENSRSGPSPCFPPHDTYDLNSCSSSSVQSNESWSALNPTIQSGDEDDEDNDDDDDELDEEYELLLVPLMMELRENDAHTSILRFSAMTDNVRMPSAATLWANIDEFCQALTGNRVVKEFHIEIRPPSRGRFIDYHARGHSQHRRPRQFYYSKFELLGRTLGSLPQLELLFFEGNHGFTFSAASCLVRHAKQISSLEWECFMPSPLSHIILRPPHVSTEAIWLADALSLHHQQQRTNVSFSSKLKKISMHLLDSQTNSIIIAALQNVIHLEELIVENCLDGQNLPSDALQEADMYTILRHNRNLKSLQINRMDISKEVGEVLSHALKHGKNNILSCSSGTDKQIFQSNLTSLSFFSCNFLGKSAHKIAKALRINTQLTRLVYRNCIVVSSGNRTVHKPGLFRALQYSLFENVTLQHLDLGGTFNDRRTGDIGNHHHLRDQSGWDLRPIGEALAVNRSLTELVLPSQYTQFSPWTPELGLCFRQSLDSNTTLRRLTLSGCGMNDTAWRHVIPFLRGAGRGSNSQLEYLLIDHNHLSEDCVIETVRLLAKWSNRTLRHLEILSALTGPTTLVECMKCLAQNNNRSLLCLSVNQFPIESFVKSEMEQLKSSILNSYFIEKLPDLRQAGFQSEFGDSIETIRCILHLNKAGRRYLIEDGPSAREVGVDVLSKVSNCLGCLYFHLRENPSLCSNSSGTRACGNNGKGEEQEKQEEHDKEMWIGGKRKYDFLFDARG